MLDKVFKWVLPAAVGAFYLSGAIVGCYNYTDFVGPDKHSRLGRTKNGAAAVISTLIADKMYENSTFEMDVKKRMYPDAVVTGQTSPGEISSFMDLVWGNTKFVGERKNGMLEGEVKKSEINWDIKQTDENTYEVGRWGPKFNGVIKLEMKDGKISGEYERHGPHWDWDIDGTYDTNGNVNVEIDGPLSLGIRLEGKVNER